jgi:hypothetical protein
MRQLLDNLLWRDAREYFPPSLPPSLPLSLSLSLSLSPACGDYSRSLPLIQRPRGLAEEIPM